MTLSTAYRRGVWILRIGTFSAFLSIAYFAYKVPLPVLPVQNKKEKQPFFQARHNVRKQLVTHTNLGTHLTTIKSPFTLMYFDADGLVEILHDMQGRSVEDEKETRFFQTKEAIFKYGTLDLTAPNMHFIVEKGVHSFPQAPYYTGNGENIHIEFVDGTPQISAGKIEGTGDIPFFFGEKKHAPRS